MDYFWGKESMTSNSLFKLNAAVRWLRSQTNRLHQERLRSRIKALVKKILIFIRYQIQTHPQWKDRLLMVSQKTGAYQALKRMDSRLIGYGQHSANQGIRLKQSQEFQLSTKAEKIYQNLKETIERQQRGQN